MKYIWHTMRVPEVHWHEKVAYMRLLVSSVALIFHDCCQVVGLMQHSSTNSVKRSTFHLAINVD